MTMQQAASVQAHREKTQYDALQIASIVLLVLAVGVSGYLAYVRWSNTAITCVIDDVFSCDAVQNSVYSEFLGVPIAYFGFATNLFLLGLVLLEKRIDFLRENGIILFFGIVLFGFLYSLWLIYVQAVLIKAYCSWCVSHEVFYVGLMVVASLRLRNFLAGSDAM